MVSGQGAVLAERGRHWYARSQASVPVIWQMALLQPVQHLYMLEEAYVLVLHSAAVSHVNERHFDGWYGDRPVNLPT
jgi:hypothetical protein